MSCGHNCDHRHGQFLHSDCSLAGQTAQACKTTFPALLHNFFCTLTASPSQAVHDLQKTGSRASRLYQISGNLQLQSDCSVQVVVCLGTRAISCTLPDYLHCVVGRCATSAAYDNDTCGQL